MANRVIDLPPMTPPMKRSVTIDGHRTSVSLEDAFWRGIADAAKARGVTRAQLIGQIDHARPPEVGLATALRLFVVAEMRRG
ncbi:ribbon-helix-helix domain-containing protein [Paracoccus sp. EF6]|uniref:Ribbon-helix-helix domain-containing protein n=2 Tax=Paracoccus benzoatiresistens TaxID=2997341 RepID=A0ABT4J3C2_9RHOB|nr:ribbon-helix-helix domain-containing protein [Paracoccus sp. EF6]MCZ0961600.1 ribbon-helix-helix domain-containing protein [Paracoccus sp. EF6]